MQEPITTAPAMELTPQAMDHLVEELRAYHAIYSPLFQRREQREGAAQYLHGLLLEIPRKSIEPMVLAGEGPNATAVRTLQWCISAGTWDDDAILQRHGQEVDQVLGEAQGVLTLDGSDLLQQGRESVGVKRQYCGAVGKRANCQAGVSLGYASHQGSTLVDRRLYRPREWMEAAAYADRRRQCGGPVDLTFKPKPALGWEMMQAVPPAHTLRARWGVCDEAFGRATTLLDPIARMGLGYLAEVPPDTQVWQQRPTTAVRPWSDQGRTPTRTRVLAGEATPAAGAPLAAALSADRWGEHSVILTFLVAAVGTVQTPDPVCRYTWHIGVPTSDAYSLHTTRPPSASTGHDRCTGWRMRGPHCPADNPHGETGARWCGPDAH